MDEETRTAIEGLKELLLSLRETDLEAVKLTRENLTRRLDGFPQQYATAAQLESVRTTASDLKAHNLSREVYENAHKALEDNVVALGSAKLDISTFNSFLDTYRLELDRSSQERTQVATTLASTAGNKEGQSATWHQITASLAGVVGILTIVILLANNVSLH